MNKILIIEDDTDINRMIAEFLTEKGYACEQAYSGTEGRLQWQLQHFDMIVLDLMLPGISGEELLEEIRRTSQVPVLILSARSAVSDKVRLLSCGADDYLGKPFELEELLARVQVQLRHAGAAVQNRTLTYREWQIDADRRMLYVTGEPVELTRQEFRIVELLAGRPKKVFTKQEIYEQVWEEDFFVEDKTINVHISNIRAKLKPTGTQDYIRTVWGIGFTLS